MPPAMHDSSPGPFTATQVVTCIGGPLDGDTLPAPANCIDFEAPDDPAIHYRYCPFASARFQTLKDLRPRFIHQSIAFDFYAQ